MELSGNHSHSKQRWLKARCLQPLPPSVNEHLRLMLIALKGTAFLLFRQSYFWTLLADPRSSLGAPISQQSAFYSKMDLSEELHRRAAVPSLVFIGREDPLTSTHNRRPRSIGYHGGNAASATPPPPPVERVFIPQSGQLPPLHMLTLLSTQH